MTPRQKEFMSPPHTESRSPFRESGPDLDSLHLSLDSAFPIDPDESADVVCLCADTCREFFSHRKISPDGLCLLCIYRVLQLLNCRLDLIEIKDLADDHVSVDHRARFLQCGLGHFVPGFHHLFFDLIAA